MTFLHGCEQDKISATVLTFSRFMSGFSGVLVEKKILHVQVCDRAAYYGPLRKHYFTLRRLSEDSAHSVPKHEGGDFVHLLCIYIQHM